MSLVERAYGWVQFLFLFFALYNWVGGDQKIHSKLEGNEVVKLVSGVVRRSVVMVWCTVVLAKNRCKIQ